MSSLPPQLSFAFATTAPSARRNLVIEAGAGTGKTTAIVGEVLQLLLDEPDLPLESILLITFTEKAAAEISDRIRDALVELRSSFEGSHPRWPASSGRPVVEVAPEKRTSSLTSLEGHLQRIDRLRSQTIHSFCHSVLQMFPVESRVSPEVHLVFGFEQNIIYREVYREWLEKETGVGGGELHLDAWRLLYSSLTNLASVEESILALLPKRDLVRDRRYSLGSADTVLTTVASALKALRALDPASITEDDKLSIALYVRENREPAGEALDEWIDYLAPIAQPLRTLSLSKGKRLVNDVFKQLRIGDKNPFEKLTKHRTALVLRETAIRFFDFLEEAKERRGIVDFDDLLIRAEAALANPTVLRGIRARYRYLFVDEFQDTDRVQAHIIDLLSRNEEGRTIPGKLTLVGDPKQSIYSFRRADPETYAATVGRLLREGAEGRYLDAQYRSDAPMVESLNAVFGAIFPEIHSPDPNLFRPTYRPLVAAKRHLLRNLPARWTFVLAEERADLPRVEAEAWAIAELIARERDRNGTDLRRFVILFRRMTHVGDYLNVMERAGIDCLLPAARSFLDQQTAVDLVSVLRAIAFPSDSAAILSAARSPYFALTDDEIFHHHARRKSEGHDCIFEAFQKALDHYRSLAKQSTVAPLVDCLLQETDAEVLYRLKRTAARDTKHLQRLTEMAIDFDENRGGSLAEFVDELLARREQESEGEPTLVDNESNAVRILTVHGAKGLEFETVILPDFGSTGSGSESVSAASIEEPPLLVLRGRVESISTETVDARGVRVSEILKRRDDTETDRLFYVAVTRAQSDVVFVAHRDLTKSSGFWKPLKLVLGTDGKGFVEDFPAQAETITDLTINDQQVAVRYLRATPELDRSTDALQQKGRLTIPFADGLIAEQVALPGDELLTRRCDVPALDRTELRIRAAGARNREAGIALHRVLELWDHDTSSLPSLIEGVVKERRLSADGRALLERRLQQIVASESYLRIRSAKTAGRETSIFVRAEGGTTEGRIDRLLLENGQWLVLDYKTGKKYAGRIDKDRAQIDRYREAVSAITGEACRGLLWYIDLDSEELVEVGT
ncbi:MAG TPA: UvrD-helicase domain-containing protein [Thermoanaerobaculia bacterium]|nr:UvrD-helicase domain-containing protein [Thermoanaerobaculia bacterium]